MATSDDPLRRELLALADELGGLAPTARPVGRPRPDQDAPQPARSGPRTPRRRIGSTNPIVATFKALVVAAAGAAVSAMFLRGLNQDEIARALDIKDSAVSELAASQAEVAALRSEVSILEGRRDEALAVDEAMIEVLDELEARVDPQEALGLIVYLHERWQTGTLDGSLTELLEDNIAALLNDAATPSNPEQPSP